MFLALTIALATDVCDTYYTSMGCSSCVTHFADAQCGWCSSLNKCISYNESSTCPAGKYYFGPNTDCKAQPTGYTPTPTPSPAPTAPPLDCAAFTDDGCEVCHSQYATRNCGWCAVTGTCMSGIPDQPNGTVNCPAAQFYFGPRATCGKPVPPPTQTPFPRVSVNPNFCKSMSGEWCTKCVTATENNMSMNCGWCHDTNECIYGDASGPAFLHCKSWDFTNTDRCQAKESHSAIVATRVTVSILVSAVIVFAIYGCYTTIWKKSSAEPQYENISGQH